jgi:ribosome recycling factor
MELIKFNHTTKEQRSELVKDIMNELLNGRVNPLELHLRLKSAEEVIKRFKEYPAVQSDYIR